MKEKLKRLAALVLTAVMVLGMLPAVTVQAEATNEGSIQAQFYVSPTGSDSNPGTKDAPLQSLEGARDAVREAKKDGMTGDIIVNFAAGDYYMDETVVFDERDSGTEEYQVIYRSEEGLDKAFLNGGTLVTGWAKTTEADVAMGLDASLVGTVYKTQLDPAVFQFNALYVDGEKAIMARTQNYVYDSRYPSQRGEYMYSAGGGMRDLYWKAGDLDQAAIDGMVAAQARGEEEIAQLFVWDGGDWDWFTNTLPINGIDESSRRVWANEIEGHPEANRTKYPIGSGARYYLQGNLAFLDVEGEYHYNKTTGELYYYPKAGQGDLSGCQIVAPRVQEIFRFQGTDKEDLSTWHLEPDLSKQVSYITIDGLTLQNTEYTNYFTSGWNYSDAGGGIWTHAPEARYDMSKSAAEQAGYASTNPSYDEQTDRTEYKVGAITMINANHLTVQNTRIRNAGLWAVAMFRDNTYHTITNCDFGYTGYGAITIDGGYPGIGKYCNHITVENVRMHDVGQNIGHAAGLTVMSCADSTFSHLEIYNSPRRAIMVSGGPKRDATDSLYDQITDMYTVRNHFAYIHVYNCEQDSGEDSAVYVCMTMRGNWIYEKYGSQCLEEDGYHVNVSFDGTDRCNYFSQMLIDSTCSNPSMRDKNTVHGMDLCMGICGSTLTNIKGTNNQSCTLRIFMEGRDIQYLDNVNNNYKSDELYDAFDDSRMDYDNIGLTDDFPFASEYTLYPEDEEHEDVYFSDDFENGVIDYTMWMAEKGEPKISSAYMAEGPLVGRGSLQLDGNRNKETYGVVLSRPFANDLNKIVEVKYFDKRQDYAGSDVNEEDVPVDITPDHWVRADDGTNVVAIGANGDVSKDYYLYQVGDKVVTTGVQRKCGWHTFKFDYSSGTDVKLYIDGELIAVLTDVATSFRYLGMGDYTGNGGTAYYDNVVIYGGQYAPAVEELPDLYSIPGTLEAENFLNVSEMETVPADEGQALTASAAGGWAEYNTKINQSGVYTVTWRVNIPAGMTAELDVAAGSETADSLTLDSTNGEWQTVTALLTLTSGLNKIKLTAQNTGWKLDSMEFTFVGAVPPCQIEAERYTAQSGTQTESCSEGSYDVGYIDAGDWTEYMVYITEPGTYKVNYRVSVNDASGTIAFLANGSTLATTTLPGTGGWQNWTTVTGKVNFHEAGVYTIRLSFVTGGYNINWFSLEKTEDEDDLPPVVERELFFEDYEGEDPTFFTPTKTGITQELTADPMDESNTVLYVGSPDGTIYLSGGEDWSNYVFESRILISEWAGNAEGQKPWDNMAPAWYITRDGTTNNYFRYALKYNREQEAFLLYKRTSGDSDFVSGAKTENFCGTWHDYKIVMDNGLITTYVDGEKIYETQDTSHSRGTIGFDGINVKYYLDDIRVSRLQTEAPSASVPGGTYEEPFTVTLTAPSGAAVIVYSLDGTDPCTYGTVYTPGKEISITENTTLKFAAIEEGKTYSDVVTEVYRFPLPAVEGEVYLDENFETGASSFQSVKGKAAIEYVADPEDESNTVMKVTSPDDLIYFPDGTDWSDYTFECRVYIAGWGGNPEGDKPWDNMAPVWYATQEDAKGNYSRYSLKYQRASETFSLYRRNTGDSDMVSAAAPANYAGSWHDYRLCAKDGVITAYVDGEEIFNYRDSALKSGTIGFDGINVTYYVDDVKVIGPHVLTAHAANDAACTEDGSSAYWSCSICGKYFSDEEAANEIEADSWVIPALGHSWDEGTVTKEPTETQEGEKTYTCERCGDTKTETLPKLERTPADKSRLEALVADAKALNGDDYTEETWNAVAAALTAAEAVLADEDAAQEEVDRALKALQAAIDGLTEKPEEPAPEVDKSALEALYNANKDKKQGSCTNTSWAVFQAMLENAKTVLNDPNATQEEVDAAEVVLREAIAGLTEKPTFPVLPVFPGNSTSKPVNEMHFTDVGKGDWFYNDVKYVYDNGIMNGVSDTKFAPESTLTRAMVVTILYRMEGEPATRYNAMFSDVENYQWYTEGVEWAAKEGIVLGYTTGKFGPNDPVTREQLAAILYRYAQSRNYVLAEGADLAAYADASNISPYAVSAVKWSVTERLLDGANGKLLPRENATRAEVAHAIAGFCQHVGK